MLNQNELLLTQAKIGCSDAFEELFQKYVPIVLKQKSAYYLRDYDLDERAQEHEQREGQREKQTPC